MLKSGEIIKVILMSEVFINKSIWSHFDETEMENYIDEVFKYYRSSGFPYFPTNDAFRENEIRKLTSYDYHRVIDSENKTIKQSMHGLSLAWSFMPHSWGVVCGRKKTPLMIFGNDVDLRGVIRKRIKMGDNMSDNGLRKMMKLYTGTQSVSNFRPTAAAAIYDTFCPKGGTVWDLSSGYGGRLLGAHLANVKYIGTDPCKKTYDGLISIAEYMGIDATIHKLGSEVFVPEANSLDFAFTSPPYFDWEEYSYEETQSFVKFRTLDEWTEGFILQSFKNAFIGLKAGAKMAINAANTRNAKDIEERVRAAAITAGFIECDTWKLALSNPTMSKTKSNFKYEPIYVFQKPN